MAKGNDNNVTMSEAELKKLKADLKEVKDFEPRKKAAVQFIVTKVIEELDELDMSIDSFVEALNANISGPKFTRGHATSSASSSNTDRKPDIYKNPNGKKGYNGQGIMPQWMKDLYDAKDVASIEKLLIPGKEHTKKIKDLIDSVKGQTPSPKPTPTPTPTATPKK